MVIEYWISSHGRKSNNKNHCKYYSDPSLLKTNLEIWSSSFIVYFPTLELASICLQKETTLKLRESSLFNLGDSDGNGNGTDRCLLGKETTSTIQMFLWEDPYTRWPGFIRNQNLKHFIPPNRSLVNGGFGKWMLSSHPIQMRLHAMVPKFFLCTQSGGHLTCALKILQVWPFQTILVGGCNQPIWKICS